MDGITALHSPNCKDTGIMSLLPQKASYTYTIFRNAIYLSERDLRHHVINAGIDYCGYAYVMSHSLDLSLG